MWKAIKEQRVKLKIPKGKSALHNLSHGTHISYFGGVFLEGHGFYAELAGILLLLGILNYFLHFE